MFTENYKSHHIKGVVPRTLVRITQTNTVSFLRLLQSCLKLHLIKNTTFLQNSSNFTTTNNVCGVGIAHSASTYHIPSLQQIFLNFFVDWDTYLVNYLLTQSPCFLSNTKNLHACSGILRRRNWKVGEEGSKRSPNFYYVHTCVGLLATKRLGICIRTSFSCWESETQSATYTKFCSSFSPAFVFPRGH